MAALIACLVLLGVAGGGLSTGVSPGPTLPPPPPFTYRLNYSPQEPCVLMEAANISTPDAPMLAHDLEVDTHMSSCVYGHANISLVLRDTNNHVLKFFFSTTLDNNGNITYWSLENVNFSSSTDGLLTNTSDLFYCKYKQSFQCDSQTDILLINSTDNSTDISKKYILTLTSWKVQAFAFTNQTFDAARHCVRDYQSSKLVPIIVGAAMAGLILVVLAAYVISQIRNWRSQRSNGSYGRLS